MNQTTWQKLDEMFAEAPFMRAEPVEESEVVETARIFGFQLPEDYQQFVCRYGGATVGPFSIYGLRAADTMGRSEASAFEVTKRFRSEGWHGVADALVISADHSGNPIYLKRNGEIWITDHDFGGSSKIADHFEDYLLNKCLI